MIFLDINNLSTVYKLHKSVCKLQLLNQPIDVDSLKVIFRTMLKGY